MSTNTIDRLASDMGARMEALRLGAKLAHDALLDNDPETAVLALQAAIDAIKNPE